MIALDSTTLLTAFNDAPDSRSFLTLATSCNGGISWARLALLEDSSRGSFSYPTLLDLPLQVRAVKSCEADVGVLAGYRRPAPLLCKVLGAA